MWSFLWFLQTMMLNDRIRSLSALQGALRKAEEHLSTLQADTPYSEFHHRYWIFLDLFSYIWIKQLKLVVVFLWFNTTSEFWMDKTGSRNLVWRRVGVTALSARRRLFTSSWIFLRPQIRPPWRSSLERSPWCSMLLSSPLMVTLLKLMSWVTLTLEARYNP